MKRLTLTTALVTLATPTFTEGTLNIYNFGLYTPPELIEKFEKFEKTHDVDVTLTEYDSNERGWRARLRHRGPFGRGGADLHHEGPLLESAPNTMGNIQECRPRMGGRFLGRGPVLFGAERLGHHGRDGQHRRLQGRHRRLRHLPDPTGRAEGRPRHAGGGEGALGLDRLRQLREFINEDLQASVFWSGAAMRIRAEDPGFDCGYPKDGFPLWQDNVAILADAQNVDNAKLFLNFIMDPENAAMISAYSG